MLGASCDTIKPTLAALNTRILARSPHALCCACAAGCDLARCSLRSIPYSTLHYIPNRPTPLLDLIYVAPESLPNAELLAVLDALASQGAPGTVM